MQNQEFQIIKNKFIESDPIGLIESGAPEDEYDGLISDILRLKKETPIFEELITKIVSLVDKDFGTTMTVEQTIRLRNNLK